MKLYNLKMTCSASPTTWLATNEQGEQVYIRFRFDCLTAHCPFSEDDDYDIFIEHCIFQQRGVTGDPFAGAMETDEMLRLTGYELVSTEPVA